jgi:putative aldouronate transport system permease protein
MIKSKSRKFGDVIIALICLVVMMICLFPMLNLLARSLSDPMTIVNRQVSFLPKVPFMRFLSAPLDDSFRVNGGTYTFSLGRNKEAFDYKERSFVFEGGTLKEFIKALNKTGDDSLKLKASLVRDKAAPGKNSLLLEYNATGISARLIFSDAAEKLAVFADIIEAPQKYVLGTSSESYRYVFKDPSFSRSMLWTAILTVIVTLVSLGITILCAFPLTYDNLKGKGVINTLIIFTMYFSAGTIPNYILMKDLSLLNNPLVLILPGCLSVFNMIILRSFFFGVPDSLRESAELDGANPFTVLIRIYLPLSAPVLATLALFYAVGRWNGFSDALLYLTSAPQYHPIQLKLYNIINNLSSIEVATQEGIAGGAPAASDGMKAAAVMFATIPILVVYPWLQRYFIAGVTIGAVKG